jgi:hypothetical protein
MSVNLTTTPYYDDFAQEKNFHRILFKPGFSVQARELTQLQTILQDQIKKFANHIFVDGSRASKEDPSALTITNNKHKSIKLLSSNTANLNVYLNTYVTGANSNTFGIVEFIFNPNDPDIGDPATIVFRKEKGNGDFQSDEVLYFYNNIDDAETKANVYVGTETCETDISIAVTGVTDALSEKITINLASAALKVGDTLYSVDTTLLQELYVTKIIDSNTVQLNENVGVGGQNVSMTFKRKATSSTAVLNASSGIYYKKGYFIYTPEQKIVPQKYTPYPDEKSVIYRYDENAINYNDDASLLDPAFGSSNYLAPGADRLKITLTLDSVDLNSTGQADVTDDFIEIARFINGRTLLNYSAVDTNYAALGDKLAERTYDESGNYSIEPFSLTPGGTTTSGLNNRFFISKGKSYIGGYEIKTSDKTEITIPKARDYETLSEIDVSSFFGRYALINAPQYGLYDPEQFNLEYYWEVHNTIDRTVMSASTRVGYITPKFIKYQSGSGPDSVYKFYWFNYEHSNPSANVESIRSIISVNNYLSTLAGNNGTYTNPHFFATIAANAGGVLDNKIIFFDWNMPSRYVFPTNKSYVKDVDNINTVYQKLFSNVQLTNGQAVITVASPNKFVGQAGYTLSSFQSQQYYTAVNKDTGAFVDSTALMFDLDPSQTSMTVSSGNPTVDTSSNFKLDIVATIINNEETIRTKTLVSNAPLLANVISSDWVSLLIPDVTALKAVYKFNTGSYPSNWAGKYVSGNTYTTGNIVTNNDKAYRALSTTTAAITDAAAWQALTPEPLLLYTLDTGQRDAVYDWARLKYVGSGASTLGYVVAIVDHFTHAGGTGPFTVNSYDASLYSKIPIYRSFDDSKLFNLRDCLDFRPARIAYAGVDAYTTTIVSRPDPLAVPGTQVDISYYLPRIDQVYVQTTDVNPKEIGNKFRVDLGISSLNPKEAQDKTDNKQQLIATLVSPPYTASATDVAVVYPNYERYTMKDIGSISTRLNDLEKRVKRQDIDIVALNNKVFDRGGVQGNVLYTTGIFVEDFSTHDAAEITSPYFTAAINTSKKECRPSFSAAQHKLFFIADPDVSYKDDLITMLYEEQNLITQIIPTGFSQVNPSGEKGSGNLNIWPIVLAGAGYYAWQYGGLAAAVEGGFAVNGVAGAASGAAAWAAAGVAGVGTAVSGAVGGAVSAAGFTGLGSAIAAANPYVVGVAAIYLGAKVIKKVWKKLFSDERLKENIVHVGKVDEINVYNFNYVWDKTEQHFGVMAVELLNTKYADAVSIHESGYYMVDYSMYEPLRKIKGI